MAPLPGVWGVYAHAVGHSRDTIPSDSEEKQVIGEEQRVSDPCDPDTEPCGCKVLVHQEHKEGDGDKATLDGDKTEVPSAQKLFRARVELDPPSLKVMKGEEAVSHVCDSNPPQDPQERPIVEINEGPFPLKVTPDITPATAKQ